MAIACVNYTSNADIFEWMVAYLVSRSKMKLYIHCSYHGCLTWLDPTRLDSESLSQKVDLHSLLNVNLSLPHSNFRAYLLDHGW